MNAATLFYTIVSVVGGILLAVISFFLRRTIGLVDKLELKVQDKADCEDITTLRKDMEKRTDKLTRDIESIREDYITKEDFFREQAKTDRKLDLILDILLGRNGNNG